MKIKRYAIGLIGLTLIVMAGACYLFFVEHQSRYSLKQQTMHEEDTSVKKQAVTDEESKYFVEFAKQALETYFEEDLAIIDPTIRSIQTDDLQKYLLTVDSVGIDNEYNIDLYHYYMVIHRSQEDQLYVMPFGIEAVKGEIDKVRQDLLISMLKSVNGWGLEYEETWQRWQDAMLNMNYKNVEPVQGRIHTTETIFYVQSLICFINEYVADYPDEAFMQISKNGLYQEVLDFEIKSITDVNKHEESYAVVEGKVRVYEKERIRDYQVEMTYKIKRNVDGTFSIVHQKGQVK